MPIVSTGQITIVDNNDARPLTGYITVNPGPQQTFSKDESSVAYVPDWTVVNGSTGIQLTAKVFIGGVGAAQDVTGVLTNRRWSLDQTNGIVGTAALISTDARMAAAFNSGAGLTFTAVHNAGGSTLTIKSNILSTLQQVTVFFEGDYTDPATGLVSRMLAQITLGLVKTGTNAVFVITRGTNAIEQATGATKNVAVVAADLMRATGVDQTGITYRFFESNGASQVDNTKATQFGLKTSTNINAIPTGIPSEIGVNLPAANAWSTHNTLVIHESAVADMEVFRVEAKDSDGTIYQANFTIYDVTDPYEVRVISSSGDKLQNGVGTTDLTPIVYYGATQVTDLTGWTFDWYFYNRNGKRGGFVDTTRTAVADGRNITANTAGVSGVVTYDGANIVVAAGDMVKVAMPNGTERFYELASGTGATLTIRTPVTNTFLSFADFPAPTASELVGSKLFICTAKRTTAGAAAVALTGFDVDVKSNILVEANRP
jgi:hypothetical protein